MNPLIVPYRAPAEMQPSIPLAEVFSVKAAPCYPVHEIRHERCRARVAHCGAQLLDWVPTGFEPVLYRSGRSVPHEKTPQRGGIPICWPWFASHSQDAALPPHGFVQAMEWNHGFTETNDDEVRLGFWLEDDESTRALWPHRFRLDVEMWLGSRLKMRLRMRNTGSSEFSAGGAFHPYFAIGSLKDTIVTGVESVAYFDKTTDREKAAESGSLMIRSEVDRIYRSTGPVEIHDNALRRRVRIACSGHRSTVIWNPGPDEAAKAVDMDPGDFDRFIAVEPALPPEQQVILPPFHEHLLTMEVSVEHAREEPR